MTRYFLPVPQVGRQPITLSPEQKRRALSQHLPVDRTDPFATDANESIRTPGKLALRRAIERLLTRPLSQAILSNTYAPGSAIIAGADDGRLTFACQQLAATSEV